MTSTAIKQTRRAYDERLDEKQNVTPYDPGVMTDFEGIGNPRVSSLVDHAYVRIGNEEAPAKVLNRKVPYISEQGVWVGVDPVDGIYQVMGQRADPYTGSGQSYYPPVAEHHASHEWESYAANGGYDLVWSSFEQITTLMVRPALDLGNFWVRMNEGPMWRGATVEWISAANGNVVTLNLTGDVPAVGSLVALVYVDANGDLQRRLSAVVPIGSLDITLTPGPSIGEYPLASVRLYSTQTSIQHNYSVQDITQLRYPQYWGAGEDTYSRDNKWLIAMGFG